MPDQIPIDPDAEIGSDAHEGVHEVLPDVGYQRLAIVNVAYVGAGGGDWVLVDAGLPGTTHRILHAVEHRFGRDARPAAIVLTHGHFDHVGALKELTERWDVPVYAHELELPYLDGSASYPPPDPSVGGGLVARAASLYPRGPVDVRPWLRTLPADGAVPGMPGWRWLHTPGHTPGHVSFWRAADRTLLAGDAVITTRQESAYAVLTQKPELHGPPMYYTPDWPGARSSTERLATLEPEILVAGHGRAMHGPALRDALHALARDFDRVAVPAHGRYVHDAARANEHGPTTHLPPEAG